MKNFNTFSMRMLLSALFVAVLCQLSYAQPATMKIKQVIVAAGGNFSDPNNHVTFGSYNPETRQYIVFDSVPGTYTADAVVDDTIAYISADTIVYMYSLSSMKRIGEVSIPGIKRMAISGNYLLVSRQYPATNNYFQVYNKSTLQLQKSFPEVDNEAEGIAILQGKAYVAVPGGYFTPTDSGRIDVIDLSTLTFEQTIYLDSTVKRIYQVHAGVNNIIATGSQHIINYNINNNTYTAKNVNAGSSFHYDGNILMLGFANGIGAYNISADSVIKEDIIAQPFTRAIRAKSGWDNFFDEIYFTETDYFSYSRLYRYTAAGEFIDSFTLAPSAEAIAYQSEMISGIEKQQKFSVEIKLFPVPAQNILNIQLSSVFANGNLSVTDLSGRTIMNFPVRNASQLQLNVSELPAGAYFIQLQGTEGASAAKFLKK